MKKTKIYQTEDASFTPTKMIEKQDDELSSI